MDKYEYLLFDLDGTLTDSAPGIINCLRHALSIMGFDMPEKPERFLGPPLYDSFAEYCGMDEEQVTKAVKLFRERYSTIGLFENSVYPEVPEMLQKLKCAGKHLMVATSKVDEYAERILARFEIADHFEFIGGALINGTRNEKCEVIEHVLASTGITDRSSVLMIGDRNTDVIGAHKTGLKCMGILWGYGSEEELRETGADYIANTPQDAADMLLGSI
ncbi:MAG TPA: HAD hydrolase-like protein [Ruminococcus sp.]|nr:HAD hydrolase-like protein [Ruminococcus sp.]